MWQGTDAGEHREAKKQKDALEMMRKKKKKKNISGAKKARVLFAQAVKKTMWHLHAFLLL